MEATQKLPLLIAEQDFLFPDRSPDLRIFAETDAFPSIAEQWCRCRLAPRLQWRNRGGLAPPSLLNPEGAWAESMKLLNYTDSSIPTCIYGVNSVLKT